MEKEAFISNLNAAGRAAAAANAKQVALDERLADAASVLGNAPMVVSAWSDPSRCPNCTIPYTDHMVYPESEKLSTVHTTANVSGNQPQVCVPIDIDEDILESVKALLFPTVRVYNEAKEGVMPLVGLLIGYDTNSGNPVIKALDCDAGMEYGGNLLFPNIPKGSPVILLSVVPEVHEEHHPSNTFILESDCPALRKDARRGDVFAFDGTFHKCYTFDEKFAAVKRQQDKLIPLPDSDVSTAMTFMSPGFDITLDDDENTMDAYMEDNHIAHMYMLLLGDASATTPATEGQNAKPAKTVTYTKGSFLYIEHSPSFKISVVPFDLFFR